MLTIDVEDQKTLLWLQKHQKRLDDTVILALPKGAQIAACGVGAACFCYLFGGSLRDALAALA